MYKAIITDLDGTAVKISSDGSDIDIETRHAVKAAQESGYVIGCATGRRWDTTKPVVEALGITAPCVISGGSAIIDPATEEIIWEQPLTFGTSKDILAIFKKHTSAGVAYLPGAEIPLTELTEVPDELRYLYLIAVPIKEAHAIAKEINGGDFAVAHMTPSWDGEHLLDVHVTHPEATKQHAVQEWQKMLGLTKEETIGMGDSGNDLPLFRAAGLRIAAGNATDELKSLADYIAPDATDRALLHVIEKFLLNQK